jgi:hypothetical protein
VDEMGNHFYLLDQLRSLLHQPELHYALRLKDGFIQRPTHSKREDGLGPG